MARKILSKTILIEVDNITADYLSESIDVSDMLGYSVQLYVEKVSGSLDIDASLLIGNWDTLPKETLPDSEKNITATTNHLYEVTTAYYNRVTINIAHTTGTYNLKIVISVKG